MLSRRSKRSTIKCLQNDIVCFDYGQDIEMVNDGQTNIEMVNKIMSRHFHGPNGLASFIKTINNFNSESDFNEKIVKFFHSAFARIILKMVGELLVIEERPFLTHLIKIYRCPMLFILHGEPKDRASKLSLIFSKRNALIPR